MQAETTKPPEATTFERSYPGSADQLRRVRADLAPLVEGCPFADCFVLLGSELCANAIEHSRSGVSGGTFTVRARVQPGKFGRMEVEDQGGPWGDKPPDDEHGRGLFLVATLAGEGNWAVEDGSTPGTRVAWAQLSWDAAW
jgi:hypothetical protein